MIATPSWTVQVEETNLLMAHQRKARLAGVAHPDKYGPAYLYMPIPHQEGLGYE